MSYGRGERQVSRGRGGAVVEQETGRAASSRRQEGEGRPANNPEGTPFSTPNHRTGIWVGKGGGVPFYFVFLCIYLFIYLFI